MTFANLNAFHTNCWSQARPRVPPRCCSHLLHTSSWGRAQHPSASIEVVSPAALTLPRHGHTIINCSTARRSRFKAQLESRAGLQHSIFLVTWSKWLRKGKLKCQQVISPHKRVTRKIYTAFGKWETLQWEALASVSRKGGVNLNASSSNKQQSHSKKSFRVPELFFLTANLPDLYQAHLLHQVTTHPRPQRCPPCIFGDLSKQSFVWVNRPKTARSRLGLPEPTHELQLQVKQKEITAAPDSSHGAIRS